MLFSSASTRRPVVISRGRPVTRSIRADAEGDREVLDARVAEVGGEALEQRSRVEQREAASADVAVEREAPPALGDLVRRSPGGQGGTDDRAHARADDPARRQAMRLERPCDTEVGPAAAPSPTQGKREAIAEVRGGAHRSVAACSAHSQSSRSFVYVNRPVSWPSAQIGASA